MKRLTVLLLIVFVTACKSNKADVEPQYASEFVGEYFTNTANGGNTTSEKWVVTAVNNMLNIDYTIDYYFKNQGKVFTSKEQYKLTNIQVLNPVTFKIDQDAELNEDGQMKTKHIEGEVTKKTNGDGAVVLGTTLKFTDPGSTNGYSTDYLEFKRK